MIKLSNCARTTAYYALRSAHRASKVLVDEAKNVGLSTGWFFRLQDMIGTVKDKIRLGLPEKRLTSAEATSKFAHYLKEINRELNIIKEQFEALTKQLENQGQERADPLNRLAENRINTVCNLAEKASYINYCLGGVGQEGSEISSYLADLRMEIRADKIVFDVFDWHRSTGQTATRYCSPDERATSTQYYADQETEAWQKIHIRKKAGRMTFFLLAHDRKYSDVEIAGFKQQLTAEKLWPEVFTSSFYAEFHDTAHLLERARHNSYYDETALKSLLVYSLIENDPVKRRGQMKMIDKYIASINTWIEILRGFKKIKKLDLSGLFRETISIRREIVVAKGLGFAVDISPGEAMVEGDSDLLRDAIGAVIDNALKYTVAGFICCKLVTIEEEGKKKAVLEITDSGIGIPSDEQEKIFEKYYRASNTGSISGSGIGLDFAKEAINSMRGDISVESEVGKGSTFRIILPLASA
ncbi:MAG: ATP-binding protein [Candidatus Margulisbacteria bacterium]|nr:ATP-binding protein [Candidatus Margulisiibacteriota bacterium]